MKNPLLLAILAGLLFGCWPLCMNRSGLSGYLSAGTFSGLCFATVLPVTLYHGFASAHDAKWRFAIAAGLVAGIALLAFNTMLADLKPEEVGSYFIITLVIQVMVPAIYQFALTGDYSAKRITGVVLALTAVFLLK